MSGPIVRRYGFANFDKIFGPKPLPHGVEDDREAEPAGGRAEGEPAREAAETPRDRPGGEGGSDR